MYSFIYDSYNELRRKNDLMPIVVMNEKIGSVIQLKTEKSKYLIEDCNNDFVLNKDLLSTIKLANKNL